jgi:hypothetical protein
LNLRNENSNKVSGKLKSMSQWENLRKYVRTSKSDDNLLGLISGLKKKESNATNGSTLLNFNEKNQQSFKQQSEFVKGSLLGSNNFHLVQIENGIQFNKGSLLTKSNEKNNNTQRSYKNSSGTLLRIDATLSRSASAQNLTTPNGKTLLELDLKPDAAHTLALRNTKIKPLLSFVPGESNVEG